MGVTALRRWADAILLDSRLGVRMLIKHRGLTLVGVFAMAVAIAVGATMFQVFSEVLDPALPFPGGDRVIGLRFVGTDAEPEQRVLHEFAALRDQLTTIEYLGAFRDVEGNLVAADTAPEPVPVAEISASAFAITGIAAEQGRYLLPTDEDPAATPVIVIGHAAWQRRFGADPNVVGRMVSLGGVSRTIVGVMPDGFEFPVDHEFWVPLRENPLRYAHGEGPAVSIFGRLVPGVTFDQAQAEVSAVAKRIAAAESTSGNRPRPVVLSFTREHSDLAQPAVVWMLRAGQWLVGALTFVVAINLAILIYARTVTRLGEIAVRSALGATRGRILRQLFIEALTLAIVGAAAGLGLSRYALEQIQSLSHANGGLPFWIQFEFSPIAVIYAFGLAVMAAMIMGVLPGLKATGASVTANLHELHGRSGTRLGRTWTALIVAQVAIAVAVLPAAVFIASRVIRMEMSGPGFPAESFVVARADFSTDTSKADVNRVRSQQLELMSRLKAEPGVIGVTFSSGIPGFAGSRQIQFEPGVRLRKLADHVPDIGITDALVPSVVRAGIDLFDTYGAQILAGRDFTVSDPGGTNAVVVNRSFVDMYLQDPNALGLRFHYVTKDERAAEWYQIVGVVRDFPAFPPNLSRTGEPTIYHPVSPGALDSVTLSVRLTGTVPAGFINRFRQLGAEVDPALQLRGVGLLSDGYNEGRAAWRSLAWAIGLVTASVLLLSAAGIYALMSFTVAQRTREIGIRNALGAQPWRLMASVFRRAAWQLAAGVLVGSVLSGAALVAIGLGLTSAMPLLLSVASIMTVVGLIAALGPARRGLRIQAIEALRANG